MENKKFIDIPINGYFYFEKGKIRKKISDTEYIWITDYDKKYSSSKENEDNQEKWTITILAEAPAIETKFEY